MSKHTLPRPAAVSFAVESEPAPAFTSQEKLIFDGIYEAYCRELQAGKLPSEDDFCKRFPAHRTLVHEVLRACWFVDENPELVRKHAPGPWPEPGTSFLGFSLEGELGRGAFARVFLATEPALGNRRVVVKVSGSLEAATEAQTLGRLHHPNIVPVYSAQLDPETGLTAVCMPFCGTATLEDVLNACRGPARPGRARAILDAVRAPSGRAGPAPEAEAPAPVFRKGAFIDGAVHLGARLAEALAFTHALGICHRDLKPSNVLLKPGGRPMLLDFNLAAGGCSAEPCLGGTPSYTPPEQLLAMGRSIGPCAIDERSDLFSLGVILYYLLAGVHPFGPLPDELTDEEWRDFMLARQRLGARPLRQVNPEVDRGLGRLIDSCLAYEANARPQSAAELAAGLRKALSVRRRAGRWLHAHRRAVLCGVAALGLGASAAGYYLATRPPYAQRQLQHGREAYRRGAYGEAIESIGRALDADPGCAAAQFALGRAWEKKGDFNRALAAFQEADRLEPSGKTKACMGYCFSRAELHAKALACYEEARAGGFETAEVLNNLGYCYLKYHQWENAWTHLSRVVNGAGLLLTADPVAVLQAACRNRARVTLEQALNSPHEALDDAVKDIELAVAHGPSSADLDYDAARVFAFAAQRRARPTAVCAGAAGAAALGSPFGTAGMLRASREPGAWSRLADAVWFGKALAHLRRAAEQGKDVRAARGDRLFAILAGEPQFQELIRAGRADRSAPASPGVLDPVADE